MANIDCPRRSQAHDIQPAYITSLHPDFPPLTPNNIQYGISSTLPHSHVYPCSSVLRPRHSWALDAHTDSPNPPFYEWATSDLQRALLYTQFDHPIYSGPAYYNNYDARPIYKPRGKAQKNQNPCSHCKLRKKKCELVQQGLCQRCQKRGQTRCHPNPLKGPATSGCNPRELNPMMESNNVALTC